MASDDVDNVAFHCASASCVQGVDEVQEAYTLARAACMANHLAPANADHVATRTSPASSFSDCVPDGEPGFLGPFPLRKPMTLKRRQRILMMEHLAASKRQMSLPRPQCSKSNCHKRRTLWLPSNRTSASSWSERQLPKCTK